MTDYVIYGISTNDQLDRLTKILTGVMPIKLYTGIAYAIRAVGRNYLGYDQERNYRAGGMCAELVKKGAVWITVEDYLAKFESLSPKPQWMYGRSVEPARDLVCTCDIHQLMREGCKCGVMAEQRRIDATVRTEM